MRKNMTLYSRREGETKAVTTIFSQFRVFSISILWEVFLLSILDSYIVGSFFSWSHLVFFAHRFQKRGKKQLFCSASTRFKLHPNGTLETFFSDGPNQFPKASERKAKIVFYPCFSSSTVSFAWLRERSSLLLSLICGSSTTHIFCSCPPLCSHGDPFSWIG